MLLLAASTVQGASDKKAVHKSVEQISKEVTQFYGSGGDLPDEYRCPRTDMPYKMTTYVGVECRLEYNVVAGSAPIVRYAWDFDSDGVIDRESKYPDAVVHTFLKRGRQIATFYAFDTFGEYDFAEIPVEVHVGPGEPKQERNSLKLSLKGLDMREHKRTSEGLGDSKSYFLLVADKEDRLWSPVRGAYHRLVDSFGYSGDEIVVVAGGYAGFGRYYYWALDDTVIVDHRYTAEGVDSAFNFLLANMTRNDDLHIVSSAHGGGHLDSLVKGWAGPTYSSYQFIGGRIFSDEQDPDLFETEDNFKLAIPGWWHMSWPFDNVGMGQWALTNWDGVFREKAEATFQDLTFINTDKQSDDDFYIERIRQYLKGDYNHNGKIETDLGEVLDWDGDGISPIGDWTNPDLRDEDDWGDLELIVDNSDSAWGNSHYLMIDDGFDGLPDMCFECWDHFPVPVVNGTDLNNDGIIDRFDANEDGDFLDSIGVDESGFKGLDNDVAEFLDSLEYRYVTAILQNCFSGGFINDMSRKDVLIAASTEERQFAYGTNFEDEMIRKLTGDNWDSFTGVDPADDRVVTFLEAINTMWWDDGARFDDNGDRIGHAAPLPNEGDGYLAAELNWGTLPPHFPPPAPISPASGEQVVEDLTPRFVWHDSAGSDSFQICISGRDTIYSCRDTIFTLPDSCRLTWAPTYYRWMVRSFKDGKFSAWSEDPYFQLVCDEGCCEGMRGNVDGDSDDVVDVLDLIFLKDFVYDFKMQPPCLMEANVDGLPSGYTTNEVPDSADVDYLNEFIFNGGPPPVDCPE